MKQIALRKKIKNYDCVTYSSVGWSMSDPTSYLTTLSVPFLCRAKLASWPLAINMHLISRPAPGSATLTIVPPQSN